MSRSPAARKCATSFGVSVACTQMWCSAPTPPRCSMKRCVPPAGVPSTGGAFSSSSELPMGMSRMSVGSAPRCLLPSGIGERVVSTIRPRPSANSCFAAARSATASPAWWMRSNMCGAPRERVSKLFRGPHDRTARAKPPVVRSGRGRQDRTLLLGGRTDACHIDQESPATRKKPSQYDRVRRRHLRGGASSRSQENLSYG